MDSRRLKYRLVRMYVNSWKAPVNESFSMEGLDEEFPVWGRHLADIPYLQLPSGH